MHKLSFIIEKQYFFHKIGPSRLIRLQFFDSGAGFAIINA